MLFISQLKITWEKKWVKENVGASEMSHQVKVLATKSVT